MKAPRNLIALAAVTLLMAIKTHSKTFHYTELTTKRSEILHALKTEGYMAVSGIPDYQEAYDTFMVQLDRFSSLPREAKAECTPAKNSNEIGYDQSIEVFNGVVDTHKGSYYAVYPEGPGNLWPKTSENLDGDAFREAFMTLCGVMKKAGLAVLDVISLPLPLDQINVLGRALDYSPIPSGSGPIQHWCGAHFDHGAFTAITPPTIKTLSGEYIAEPNDVGLHIRDVGKAQIPPGCLGFQVGEVSQLLTEKKSNELRATEHWVEGGYGMWRRTVALFFSPPLDFVIDSESDAFPSRYRKGMTFGEWHRESLARYSVVSKD